MQINKYARSIFRGQGGLDRFFRDLDSDMSELNRRVDTALRYKSFTVTIMVKTTGTKIFHHLDRKPVNVRVLAKADARVWEVSRDTRHVTLASSADVMCEVEVKG